MQQYKRAEITVFLALLLSSLCIFICALIESGRLSMLRYQVENVMETGLLAVFGEYERRMLSKYDLFFIDTGYLGKDEPGKKSCARHLKEYIMENLDTKASGNLLKLKVSKVNVKRFSAATDNQGGVLMRQITEYMNVCGTYDYYPQADSDIASINSTKDPGFIAAWDALIEETIACGAYFNNPALIVRNLCRDEYALITEGIALNNCSAPYSSLPSNRSLITGNGPGYLSLGGDQRAFSEYTVKKLGCHLREMGTGYLTGELEYIAYGELTDEDNLRRMIDEVMESRAGANLQVIKGDEEMQEQALELALSSIDSYDDLMLIEIMKEAIIYSWAYAEAAVEVHGLLAGGFCPVSPTKEGWIISIWELLEFKNCMGETKGGIDYIEYLAALILNTDINTRKMRLCDIIEMNIRSMGNRGFMIDGCIEYVEAEAYFDSGYGYEKHITRERTYVK